MNCMSMSLSVHPYCAHYWEKDFFSTLLGKGGVKGADIISGYISRCLKTVLQINLCYSIEQFIFSIQNTFQIQSENTLNANHAHSILSLHRGVFEGRGGGEGFNIFAVLPIETARYSGCFTYGQRSHLSFFELFYIFLNTNLNIGTR